MRSVNMVVLVGNVGNDPEIRSTTNGKRVATLPLATTYGWGKGDERQEKTEWHRIIAWEALADLAENYITKGARLYVQGRIQYRSWEDKEGQTRYTTEIVATEIVMLDRKSESERGTGATGRAAAGGSDEWENTDRDSYDRDDETAPATKTPGRPAPAAKRAAPAKRATARR